MIVGMMPRFTPLKPKLKKLPVGWCVFIPNLVFGDRATGSIHGPFPNWNEGLTGALACSAAMHNSLRASNAAPMQIGVMN